MLSTTILAARRVLPPDLMTPAKASKPRMKLSGPEAVPPPERSSLAPRIMDRFVPVPDIHRVRVPVPTAALVLRLEPVAADIEPDRRVERNLLMYKEIGEIGLEGFCAFLAIEVASGQTR